MINYDPWGESHAPKRFERTDPTGRWSPIHEGQNEPSWVAVLGGIAAGVFFALMVYFYLAMLYWEQSK